MRAGERRLNLKHQVGPGARKRQLCWAFANLSDAPPSPASHSDSGPAKQAGRSTTEEPRPTSQNSTLQIGALIHVKKRKLKQQSRRRYAANGFAFVPHTCGFLGQQSLGVEPAVKLVLLAFTQSDRRRIAPTQLRSRAICLRWKNKGCNENAEVRAGRLAQRAICLWLPLRAKQEMLLLLADEVRPCLI
jgi:hypothetical protein